MRFTCPSQIICKNNESNYQHKVSYSCQVMNMHCFEFHKVHHRVQKTKEMYLINKWMLSIFKAVVWTNRKLPTKAAFHQRMCSLCLTWPWRTVMSAIHHKEYHQWSRTREGKALKGWSPFICPVTEHEEQVEESRECIDLNSAGEGGEGGKTKQCLLFGATQPDKEGISLSRE